MAQNLSGTIALTILRARIATRVREKLAWLALHQNTLPSFRGEVFETLTTLLCNIKVGLAGCVTRTCENLGCQIIQALALGYMTVVALRLHQLARLLRLAPLTALRTGDDIGPITSSEAGAGFARVRVRVQVLIWVGADTRARHDALVRSALALLSNGRECLPALEKAI